MSRPSRDQDLASRKPGVATFVVLAGKSLPEIKGEELYADARVKIVACDLPSQAVAAAVRVVATSKGAIAAAVGAGEFDPQNANPTFDRLKGVVAMAEPGQVVMTLAAQELARGALPTEYEFASLGSHDVGLGGLERLFLVRHPDLRRKPHEPKRTSNGVRTTIFIGRSRELEELRRVIDLSHVVSLTGPSGIGKSALLDRYLTDVEGEYPDGAVKVDLSPIAQPDLVGPTLVRELGAPKLVGESHEEALVAYFRPRRALLILDNAEHVLGEVRRYVSALADACNDLAIVVGSQRPLRVAGETRFKLEGLQVPAYAEDWRAMEEYDAIALFVDRAQLVDPRFRLSSENAAAVAMLCQRLDGIPLAIELAASKTQALSPRQILDRLDDRFLLLKDKDSGRPDRQQTLETTVDWGYSHLRNEAKLLLRRLSIFNGAFTVDEAAAVVADSELPFDSVLGAFEELIDGSMFALSTVRSAEKRFYLTETIRIYARKRLREAGEEGRMTESHERWCASLADRAREGISGPSQITWLERLDASYEDLRAVIIRNAAPKQDCHLAVRMLMSINQYFFLRSYLSEGLRLVKKVADTRGCQSAPEFSRVLNLGALLASHLGDDETSRAFTIRGLKRARKEGNVSALSLIRSTLAFRAAELGRPAKSRRHYLAAIRGFRQVGDHVRLLKVLISVAAIEADLGYYDETQQHLDEAATLFAYYQDPSVRGFFHQNSAHVALTLRHPMEALRHSRMALEIFGGAEEPGGYATSLRNAAYAYEMMGDMWNATRFAGAAVTAAKRVEHRETAYLEALDGLMERLRARLGSNYMMEFLRGTDATFEELLRILDET